MHRSLEHEKAALECEIRALRDECTQALREQQGRIDKLERRVAALEPRAAAPCAGKAKGHDWVLRDERAPHMGYRCKKCGMTAA